MAQRDRLVRLMARLLDAAIDGSIRLTAALVAVRTAPAFEVLAPESASDPLPDLVDAVFARLEAEAQAKAEAARAPRYLPSQAALEAAAVAGGCWEHVVLLEQAPFVPTYVRLGPSAGGARPS